MTVNPITIDLRDSGQMMSSKIANMQAIPCVNVSVSVTNICSWIESKGGWTAITAYDIMTLVNAYLGLVPIDFPVTMAYILGAISYYLDIVDSGNAYTGCQFA